MNPLIFPITYLEPSLLRILSIFFKTATVLLPAERIFKATDSNIDADISVMLKEETPFLLNNRLEDFKATLKALQNWGSGIGLDVRFSAQALLQLEKSTAEMTHNIISALKGSDEDDFVQALLLLGLAHERDRTDAEVNMDMTMLEQKQNLIRLALNGATDLPELPELHNAHDAQTPSARLIPYQPPENIYARLKPWAMLAKHFSNAQAVPLGIGIDLKDRFDVACEAARARHQDLLCLQIPQRQIDSKWLAPHLERISANLSQLNTYESGLNKPTEATSALQAEWEQQFGTVKTSNTFYLSRYEISASELLCKTTGLQDAKFPVVEGRLMFFIT